MSQIIPFPMYHKDHSTPAEVHQGVMASQNRNAAINRTVMQALRVATSLPSRAAALVFRPDHDTLRAIEHRLGEKKSASVKVADGNGGLNVTIARGNNGEYAFIPEEDLGAD